MKKNIKKNSIIIYSDKKSGVKLETHLENESIWLTQEQIAKAFDTDRTSITKHIGNIFKTNELIEKRNVQKLHIANSDKPIKIFNLDVILSVGYRVNSQKATKFRIWATNVLKKHIVDGYTINETRLFEANNKLKELHQAILLIEDVSKKKSLVGQTDEILNILSKYSKALTILDEYDRESFKEIKGTKETKYKLNYEDCVKVIKEVKNKFVEDGEKEVFAQEKDWSFKSVIENLYQTYNSKELYKTTEEKAANLLYLVIKDHSFIGGNKRVASILFAYFLEKTDILYKDNGERKINDSGLVALTLLIAESNPKDKDILVKMIKNLLV